MGLKGEFTAAVLACGRDAVLSHHAAGTWHGMLRWRARSIEVIVPRGAGRQADGIRPRFSRSLDRRDVWRRDSVLVTSPARTALDLAAELPPKALRRMIRQALAEGIVSIAQLADVVARTPWHRGAGAMQAIVADGHVPTRSELEDRALDLLEAAGVERPEANAELVLDGRRIRPDLLWRRLRVVIECGCEQDGKRIIRNGEAELRV